MFQYCRSEEISKGANIWKGEKQGYKQQKKWLRILQFNPLSVDHLSATISLLEHNREWAGSVLWPILIDIGSWMSLGCSIFYEQIFIFNSKCNSSPRLLFLWTLSEITHFSLSCLQFYQPFLSRILQSSMRQPSKQKASRSLPGSLPLALWESFCVSNPTPL